MPRKKSVCAECGGTLQSELITHTQPWGEKLYRFENVPAYVCVQCGHVWLEARISQLIDETIQKHRKPDRYQKVPVFSLSKAV